MRKFAAALTLTLTLTLTPAQTWAAPDVTGAPEPARPLPCMWMCIPTLGCSWVCPKTPRPICSPLISQEGCDPAPECTGPNGDGDCGSPWQQILAFLGI